MNIPRNNVKVIHKTIKIVFFLSKRKGCASVCVCVGVFATLSILLNFGVEFFSWIEFSAGTIFNFHGNKKTTTEKNIEENSEEKNTETWKFVDKTCRPPLKTKSADQNKFVRRSQTGKR